MTEVENTVGGEESDDDDQLGDGPQDAAPAKKKKRRPKKKNAASAQGTVGESEGPGDAGAVSTEPTAEAAVEQEVNKAAEAEVSDVEVEVGGSAPAKKKKRKPKKKGSGVPDEAAEGAVAADDDVTAEGATGAPDETAAEEVGGGPADEDRDDAEAGADVGAEPGDEAGKKKRRKPKKKAAEPASEQPGEESQGEAGELHAEDSEEECDAAEAPSQDTSAPKKKKRRPKKKGGGGGAQAPSDQSLKVSDEEFAAWAKSALEATANGTEKMSKEELIRPPQSFWGYKYTGSLRPAYVSPQMKMPAGWCMPDYALEPEGVSISERQGPKEVPVLEGSNLETMREACRLGREVLDIAARFMRAGVTGDEIDRVVFQACVDRKVYPSPLNYYRFPKSVCVSPNEVICHGIPDSRPIEEGDVVNLDVSIYHQGFHADLNETYFVGDCDEDSHRLVRTAYCALHAAAKLIRPGTFYRDLGNAIHAEAAKSNCAVVTTYCGHGVGQLFHGPPKVPHYRKNKAVGIMKPGHVFTVEPMINLGSNGGDRTWPDKWTAVTRDGKRSAQFEHTFLVTEQGLEVLTCRLGTDRSAMPPYDPAMFQL